VNAVVVDVLGKRLLEHVVNLLLQGTHAQHLHFGPLKINKNENQRTKKKNINKKSRRTWVWMVTLRDGGRDELPNDELSSPELDGARRGAGAGGSTSEDGVDVPGAPSANSAVPYEYRNPKCATPDNS
jgi:hypothetical protein